MSQGLTRIAGRAECRGKAVQAISNLLSLPRAALRLPPVTYIGRAMCITKGQGLAVP